MEEQVAFTPRHEECGECIHARRHGPAPSCLQCGAGEFFEPKDDASKPSEEELMIMGWEDALDGSN